MCSRISSKLYTKLKRGVMGKFFFLMGIAIFIPPSVVTYTVSLHEGGEFTYTCPYSCVSTEVTLQFENSPPFYNSSSTKSSVPSHLGDRFSVENKIENDSCSLHLIINPVRRIDKGLYICKSYQDGQEPDLRKFYLYVNFPPGDASCHESEEDNNPVAGDWVILSCSALAGNHQQGRIDCYQNDKSAPPKTDLTETEGTLRQKLWILSAKFAFCCSSAIHERTDRCRCKDYIWVPPNSSISNGGVDPCAITTRNPSSSSSTAATTATASTTATVSTTQENKNTNKSMQWLIWLGVVLFVGLLLLGVSVRLCYALKKTRVLEDRVLESQRTIEEQTKLLEKVTAV